MTSRVVSADPSVVTHPDGSQTYTPGLKSVKLAVTFFGALIFLTGILWLMMPIRLLLLGSTAEAQVQFVMEEKPGQEPVRLDTRKAVDEASDPTRNATYVYHVIFETESGQIIQTTLNYAQVNRPILSIGDSFLIAYDRKKPLTIIDKWSVRTWAFGMFFTGIGLFIFIPQILFFMTANKPILLDSIRDYEDDKGSQPQPVSDPKMGAGNGKVDEKNSPAR